MNDGVTAAAPATSSPGVDAHSRIAPDYLRRVVAALRRHPEAAAVGGPFLPEGTTPMERAVGVARSSWLGVGGGYGTDRTADDHGVRSVQCGAYWRDAILDVGLFDPAMVHGEDEELNWRLVQGGWAIVLCPALRQPYRPRGQRRRRAPTVLELRAGPCAGPVQAPGLLAAARTSHRARSS
jgi:succinoglycan biosynthesis protein ExoA